MATNTSYTSNPYDNPLAFGPNPNVNPIAPVPNQPTISGTNIGTVKPLILSPYVPSTLASGMQESLTSQNTAVQKASQQEAEDKAAMDENRANLETNRSDIAILSEQIGGAGKVGERAFQAEGGDNAKRSIDEYTSQLEAEQLSNRRRLDELDKTYTGTTAGLATEKGRINRESLSTQADLAILQNAALRKYDTAVSIADRKKELYLEPLKQRKETLEFFYKENKADFTKDEDRMFDAAVKKADREYEEEKDRQDSVTGMIKGALVAGASGSIVKKAMDLANSGADELQVAQSLGVYADIKTSLEIKKLRAEIKKAEAVDPGIDPAQVIGTVSGGMGGSILAQTGLSLLAFNYMTQGTPALSRLGEAQRNKVFKESQDFLNKNGLDVSTFQSRFKAYNETLSKNIQRFNNTQIAEGEIEGTIENLSIAADAKDFGSLKVANVAKLFAGEQVNDPATLKYQVHLNQLRSELAFYNAAVQGKTAADLIEFQEAERIIKNGLSSGSLSGFQSALNSSVKKMGQVMQGSVDRSSKQVWGLFGLADKYQSQYQKEEAAAANNPFSSSLKNDGNIINNLGDWMVPVH